MSSLVDNLYPVEGPVPEGTDEWAKARLGRLTASDRAQRMMSENPIVWNAILDEMEQELMTGEPYRTFRGNRHTDHGHAFEAQAIAMYEMEDPNVGEIVRKPGFLVHPDCALLGATPDFLEDEDHTGQVKCPSIPANHIKIFYYGVPPNYFLQTQIESLVTGRPLITFLSYDPRQPALQQLFISHYHADTDLQARILRRAKDLFGMLKSGHRYGEGVLTVARGIPNLF